jgi:DNA-directed RNA polymerase subunit RPC12/RpoP
VIDGNTIVNGTKGTTMPRLIGILLILLAGIGLVRWLSRRSQQHRGEGARAGKTFRPRHWSGSSNDATSPMGSADDIYMMSKRSVTAVCDALTGAPLNLNKARGSIWRCVKCSSLYNQSSVAALEKDNAGACVQCSSKVRAMVTLTDD